MTLDEHEAQKARWEKYRVAVRRLYPQAKLSPLCHVGEPANRDGAFIEIAVWIPVSEIEDPKWVQGSSEKQCAHGHTVRQVGCVSCVLVWDRPADR